MHFFYVPGQNCDEHPLQRNLPNEDYEDLEVRTTPKMEIFRINLQRVGDRWMAPDPKNKVEQRTMSNLENKIIHAANKEYKEKSIDEKNILNHDGFLQHCSTEEILSTYKPSPYSKNVRNFHKKFNKVKESSQNRRQNFTNIWRKKIWGKWEASSEFSSSGEGSTLAWTKKYVFPALNNIINNLRKALKINVVKILDVGCGDMIWMSYYLKKRRDIEYTCIDIVPELINTLKNMYKSEDWAFTQHDIADSPFYGKYNLVILRMVLQHLNDKDIGRVFRHISMMKIDYTLMTSFSSVEKNAELSLHDNPSRFRPVNLEIPPFELIPPSCTIDDGSGDKYFLGLWKLPLKRIFHCNRINPFLWAGRPKKRFSCSVLLIYL